MLPPCQAPGCQRISTRRKTFRDPRRGSDEIAYVQRFICDSDYCELAVVDDLDHQAQCARIVYSAPMQ